MPFPVIMGAAAACITMKNVIRSLPADAEKGERAREPRQLRREKTGEGREGAEIGWNRREDGAVEVVGSPDPCLQPPCSSNIFQDFPPSLFPFSARGAVLIFEVSVGLVGKQAASV